jgi:predicted permease
MTLAELIRRAKYLLLRDRYTRELEEEMRLHRQLRAERLQGGGLAPAAARYTAQRKFGNTINHQERSRDMWGLDWLDNTVADLRFAFRRLRARPAFALSTIVVAALGIGATTAVFSAVDAALLRPLPFHKPSQLVTLTDIDVPFSMERNERNNPRRTLDMYDIDSMPSVFSNVAAYAAGGLNLEDPQNPRRVVTGVVTASFFSTLGAKPARGRLFAGTEGTPDGPRVAILGDAIWRGHFGGDTAIVGKSISLSGNRYEVVGVMPPGFSFPSESDLWIPMSIPTTFETFAPFRGWLPSSVIARLAPGLSVTTGSAQLMARWERALGKPVNGKRERFDDTLDELRSGGVAVPMQESVVQRQRKAFLILMGATTLLLLIACANVANLLLSDGTGRRREIAVREVLGAGRARIIRQLLAESLLLSLAGTLLGLVLAPMTLGWLRALLPASVAGTMPIHIDMRVLIFAVGLAIVTGISFGLWPALGTAKVDPGEAIKSGGGHGATAGKLGGIRRTLITAEVTLTVMLLVGSGLMLKSFYRLMTQDFGMSTDHVGTMELSFPRSGVRSQASAETERNKRVVEGVLARLRRDPSITAAGVVNDLPLRGGGGISISIRLLGMPTPEDADYPRNLVADAGFFRTMAIPLLRGRLFEATDDTVGPRPLVINQRMAEVYWPGLNPIGKQIYFGGDTTVSYSVIGMVANVREGSADTDPRPQMYFSTRDRGYGNLAIVARSGLPERELLGRMNAAMRAEAPAQAVYNVKMMDDVLAKSVAPRRTNTMLIALFGGLALILSAFGVYAVVSYSVAQRAREFGIRTALGAERRDILALVGGDMTRLIAIGLIIGMIGAWMMSRVLASLLYGVDTHDFATYAMVPLILLLPAAIATLIPTLRAMRVSPTEVMRAE